MFIYSFNNNYRPIFGLVQIRKLFEKTILKNIIKLINNNVLDYRQYGFRQFRAGCSTINCNLSFQILFAFKENRQVDVIFTDFEKDFNPANPELLLIALNRVGFGDSLLL